MIIVRMIILFFFLNSPLLLANECPLPIIANSSLEDIQQALVPKICSVQNSNLFSTPKKSLVQLETKRLSTKCADNWPVKTKDGVKIIPAGLKVIKLNDEEIIFHLQGKVYQGKITKEAWSGKPGCAEPEEKANFEAFKEEALFQLNLAQKINPKTNLYFDQTVQQLKQKINDLELSEKEMQQLEKRWKETLIRTNISKPQQVSHFHKMIASVYDPKEGNQKSSERTLIVPLSVEWFESDPELKAFFEKEWIQSGYDIRIMSGYSGEGVTYNSKHTSEMNESFSQMSQLMAKTFKFLKNDIINKSILNSPEAQWLSQNNSFDLKKYARMIFFSPATWHENPEKRKWADYIPVDQSLGGLPSDYLLSVMIHEINVNSPNFLCYDTHGPEEETDIIRQCVLESGVGQIGDDPITLQRLFGQNAQLSVVYLKMMLEKY